MEIKHHKFDKASFITFENVFDHNELDQIWKEVDFLCYDHKFLDPSKTGSAKRDEHFLKKNKGIWLDEIYFNRNISNYLSLYKKGIEIINNEKNELIKNDINLKLFFDTNYDITLMNYYENEDYYESHYDSACYTYVFWLFKEPKKFLGGDLIFNELKYKINVNSNMGILFPSWIDHEVDKIQMCESIEKFKSNGRFSFSTFFNHKGM
jgi:hypothetical protein